MKSSWIWEFIQNPVNIKRHNFYPFISYEKDYSKYNSHIQDKAQRKKEKYRELCYSTHLDRCIYQYYGFCLNELYNKRVVEDSINDVAVAYRNNLHKSNIQFAREVIDFIRKTKQCYVLVGDFKSFFDSLDHIYLKKQLCDLLGKEKLPDDYYAVYKNITKYAMCRLEDILEFFGKKDTYKNRRLINEKNCIMTKNEFKLFKKKTFENQRKGKLEGDERHKAVEKNISFKGIPQGSAISAVFANVYMLSFDKKIHDYVHHNHGLYMRYCDDFIVVLPKTTDNLFKQQYVRLQSEIHQIPSLIVEPKKTQIYEYTAETIINRSTDFVDGASAGKNSLDYLGFTFDGKKVTLRDKTISKYYYRMYRQVKEVLYWSLKKHRLQTKKLYNLYSAHRNFDQQKEAHGNFLLYVKRAQKEFGDDEPIDRGTKRHMLKIKRAIQKIKLQ